MSELGDGQAKAPFNSETGSALSVVVQGWKLRGRCLSATTPNAPGRRHCSESERRYPASIHAVCLEKPLAAVPGLVSAAIFSHIWWRTVSVHNLYLHSINTRRGAPPEEQFDAVIRQRFGLPLRMDIAVKYADLVMLATECRDLDIDDGQVWPMLEGVSPADIVINPVMPLQARAMFIARFNELTEWGVL